MDSMIRGRNRSTTHPSRIRGGRPMDSMIRGRNSEGKSRFVLVDDDGRLVMGYRNLEAGGRPNEVEGNNMGPYVVVGNTTPIGMVNVPDRRVTTIIDDDTFDATVVSSDIDMTGYRNGLLTISLGAMNGTPTMTPSVEVKDSNGNYITFDTLPVMSASNESVSWSFYDLPDTVRVVCTLASTTSFADVTVEWTAMN